MAVGALERTPAERLRDGLLDSAWERLDLLEQLGAGPSERLLMRRLEAERARVPDRVPPLKRWRGMSKSLYATYTEGANPVRLARLLDFVEEGDRVLDIGTGHGYVTSLLARTGLLEYYCGIDLTDRYMEDVRRGLEVNELPTENVHLEVGNLLELTPEWVAQHDPSLVLVLEVLEHIPDAQQALKRLGRALGPGTSVLFTVPMFGRLEGVMGHVSVFDGHRIRKLCDGAGLTLQFVEPLHNSWTLVLATTTPDVPSRLFAAAGTSIADPPPAKLKHYKFRDADLSAPSATYERSDRPQEGRVLVRKTREGIRCEISPVPLKPPPYNGGITVPIQAFGILRLQVEYRRADAIKAMVVDAYAGADRVGRWRWDVEAKPAESGVMMHLLKPGSGGRFQPVGRIDNRRIDRIELHAELMPDAVEAAFTLRRAAYLPASSP